MKILAILALINIAQNKTKNDDLVVVEQNFIITLHDISLHPLIPPVHFLRPRISNHTTICGLHLFLSSRLFLRADLRPVLLTTVHRMSLQYTYVQNLVTLARLTEESCSDASLSLSLESWRKCQISEATY